MAVPSRNSAHTPAAGTARLPPLSAQHFRLTSTHVASHHPVKVCAARADPLILSLPTGSMSAGHSGSELMTDEERGGLSGPEDAGVSGASREPVPRHRPVESPPWHVERGA